MLPLVVIAVPALVLAGPIFGRLLTGIPARPLAGMKAKPLPESELPGPVVSILTALLPAVLLVATTAAGWLVADDSPAAAAMAFVSDPDVVMIVALLVASVTLGLARGRPLATVAIRLCVGSATVAGFTAAGILTPIVAAGGVEPNLMVLAIGAGSLFGSHVNDAAFCMFKAFFGLGITDTLKTWTVLEPIVSLVGLAGVLALAQIV